MEELSDITQLMNEERMGKPGPKRLLVKGIFYIYRNFKLKWKGTPSNFTTHLE